MTAPDFYLTLFAFTAPPPKGRLENRMNQFLLGEPTTESLDGSEFSRVNAHGTKADYLLANRGFIAELKTINGNPKDRVEQRLKARFAQPGAPIVFGSVGMEAVLKDMPDREDVLKVMHDLSSRAVRRHLQKSNEQIGAIKARLNLPSAAGLTILMNDSEQMIDAINIGFAIKTAFETVEGGYPDVSYIWASIECHRIRMPDGSEGFPQLLVTKHMTPGPELDFLGRMLAVWAYSNGGRLHQIPHNGDWDVMRPIYAGQPPRLALF